MEWVRSMLSGVTGAFDQAGAGPVAIPFAFVLGLLSAVVSACCTLPVLSIVVGYAGIRSDNGIRARLLSSGVFVLGAALALVVLGGVAAVIGQVAQGVLGRYWKLFAGIAAVVMGLGALNLLPFNLLEVENRLRADPKRKGWIGSLVFGLVGGGAVSVSSLACNPGIFIVLGAAMLQGFTFWVVWVLVAYALGFSMPLGAVMLGVSFATAAARFKGVESVVRTGAGVLLICVGFYFLWTF